MSELLREMSNTAQHLGIPLGVQLDLTYRCNERCVHCYLDHDDHGEMNTAEIKDLLDQLAAAGVFFLTISGGEILMRRDFFEIVEYARRLMFCVKLKTNAVMIHESEADRIQALAPESVQISVYSHRPEVHDAITKLPGSLRRSLEAIRHLKANGVKVSITNVLMKQNAANGKAVQKMATEMGVDFAIDPIITPMLNGDWSITNLGISKEELNEVFRTEEFVGNVGEFCAPVSTVDEDVLEGYSCSAGHTLAYISPTGDVYPCVQFPMPCGSLREKTFHEIWYRSAELTELRSVKVRDLPTCSHCSHTAYCSRCPGLAYMEGNMRGPSSLDCAKSEARTGIPSAWQVSPGYSSSKLVQIGVA